MMIWAYPFRFVDKCSQSSINLLKIVTNFAHKKKMCGRDVNNQHLTLLCLFLTAIVDLCIYRQPFTYATCYFHLQRETGVKYLNSAAYTQVRLNISIAVQLLPCDAMDIYVLLLFCLYMCSALHFLYAYIHIVPRRICCFTWIWYL